LQQALDMSKRLTTRQAEIENQRLAKEKLFNEFWIMYPKKTSKSKARKAYLKALQKTPHENIMAGLSRHTFDRASTCNPSAWLNQQRWK
jgi:hypothetical protein